MNPARLQEEDRHKRKNNRIKKPIKRNQIIRRSRIVAQNKKEAIKVMETKNVFALNDHN